MGTIFVSAFLVLIVVAIINNLIHDKRKGKSTCGYSSCGGCKHCKACAR